MTFTILKVFKGVLEAFCVIFLLSCDLEEFFIVNLFLGVNLIKFLLTFAGVKTFDEVCGFMDEGVCSVSLFKMKFSRSGLASLPKN